jgi:hypothetical protein
MIGLRKVGDACGALGLFVFAELGGLNVGRASKMLAPP